MAKANSKTAESPTQAVLESVTLDIKSHIIDDNGTVLETQTVVEDRTDNPEGESQVEYEIEHAEVGDKGTILTTYGEPVGGFPEANRGSE